LAQTQQSTVAWMINVAMWRVWYELDAQLNLGAAPKPGDPNRVWLLGQVHDALLGMYRSEDTEVLSRIKAILETPIRIRDTLVVISAEILIGKSWWKGTKEKPGDLRVWHG
jgi:DNA polymerase I-like protein with 3'-5' exonuclease and polymerase domains